MNENTTIPGPLDAIVPAAPPAPSLPVVGRDERFPIRRVYCVGRNYADHAREMGADPDREPPFFFTKPADAVWAAAEGSADLGLAPSTVPYPGATDDFQFEVELVVAIGVAGADIDAEDALQHVWGYGVGIDLTRRDVQAEAKALRRPWDLAKGFDASAPCSPLVSAATTGHPLSGRIHLDVGDATRQDGDLADQIWPVADVIAHLSRSVELRPGDLIMTGTPAGVGPIVAGDHVTAAIEGVGELSFDVIPRD